MNNIALVDMDGTLCDYEGTLNSKMQEVLGEKVETWDPKYKRLVDLIKSHPGFWYDLPPIQFGMDLVKYFQKTDWEVHILTKGPYHATSAWSEKVEWCRHFLPGTPVTITENKSLVYGRILFDDWPVYCRSWLKWRPRGLVIMPRYDYNKEFEREHPGSVIRAEYANFDEVKSIVDSVAKRKPGETW